jgi:hypothetical protein
LSIGTLVTLREKDMFKPIVVEIDGERYDFREIVEFKTDGLRNIPPTIVVQAYGEKSKTLEGHAAEVFTNLFKQYVLYGV